MNLKLIVAILVIAAVPVCAQAQAPSAAKVTKADAQKVVNLEQKADNNLRACSLCPSFI